jgi:CheY-like chemotaxis protein
MPRTILLADDSITIRKVVELTFSDTDIRVESVGSGRDALDRLAELRPDLVLADVVMPGPSGYEVCRTVKASTRPVPVLLLTGTFEPFDADEARACGSDGHVTKPFDSRSLVERVEALLARGAAAPTKAAAGNDDLEQMFDDLAAPASKPGASDASVATPVETLRVAEPERPYEPARASTADQEPATVEDPVQGSFDARTHGAAVSERAVGVTTLSPADIDAVARAVVERLSDRVLREIAWDVVPDLAEIVVRERIRDLERDDPESS